MAILFSKVELTSGNRSSSFLVSGIPTDKEAFKGWTAYEAFMDESPKNETISVVVNSYLYGEREPVIATPEEVAYMQMRIDRRPDFLESRCEHNLSVEYSITAL